MIQKTAAVLATITVLAAPALAVEVPPNNEAQQEKVGTLISKGTYHIVLDSELPAVEGSAFPRIALAASSSYCSSSLFLVLP